MNLRIAIVSLMLSGICAAEVAASQVGSDTERSLTLCDRAEEARYDDERAALLERGLRLAEQAVAADRDDARAHLALFCNLGRQIDGDGLGFRTIGKLRRARGAIERAFELGPDDADILVAMGAFLIELPAMFGGDRERGEQYLRRSLLVDAGHDGARRYLSRLHGERPDAAAVCESCELASATTRH